MYSFFQKIPNETILKIFSYFFTKDLITVVSRVDSRFYNVAKYLQLLRFKTTCLKIESDQNYQPDIQNAELLNLVVDQKDNWTPRLIPRRNALAIQPSSIKTTFGKLYQIKIATKGPIDESNLSFWHVDDSAIILAKHDGSASCHSTQDAERGDFDKPLQHLNLEKFLGCECLHNQNHLDSHPIPLSHK
jgi:F-box-like